MKRFTVPADFSGTKYPFFVYVLEWPTDYKYADGKPIEGIDDQLMWLKTARGGTVADDIAVSFRKLQRIARANNVSFPDLTVYALGEAQQQTVPEAGPDILKALAANLKAHPLGPNAETSVDSLGVAIRGYDPVSYFSDGKPFVGRPENYAIWNHSIWLFTTQQHRAQFQANPAQFAPAFGGFCAYCVAVGDKVHGDPEKWAIHQGRLYLHKSDDARTAWLKDPDGFVAKAMHAWPDLRAMHIAADKDTKLADQMRDYIAKQERDAPITEEQLVRALNVVKEKVAKTPGDTKSQRNLVILLRALAAERYMKKNPASALSLITEAANRAKMLYGETKALEDAEAYQLALSFQSSLQDDQGQHAAALASKQAQIAVLRTLVVANPKRATELVRALGNLSWYALMTRQWNVAKAATDEALNNKPLEASPEYLWIATNAAHARMFGGDAAGARAIYLKYRGQKIPDHDLWEKVVLADFAQFRAAHLGHPALMAEIESLFASKH